MDTIPTDGRVMNLSTGIKLARKVFNWLDSEDEELRLYLVDIFRAGKHQRHIDVMNGRRAHYRRARRMGKE